MQPRTPRWQRIALVVLAGALYAPDARAQAERADAELIARGRPLVVGIELKGVKSVDLDELRDGLATRATTCRSLLYTPLCLLSRSPVFAQRAYLNAEEVRRDQLRIRLYYWKRGFRDTRVVARTTPAKGGVVVRFDVTENEATIAERIDVTPTTELTPRVIATLLPLRAGDPLDLVALDSSAMLMRDALRERGFADAYVRLDTTQISNEENRGPVAIELSPGRRTTVERLIIEGNRHIESRTVQRLMQVAPGEVLKRSDLLASQRDLYLSGLFSEVDIEALVTSDSAKIVRVKLREAALNRLELNAGFTNADFLQVEAAFSRYHFLGDARRLTLRTTASNLFARQLNGAGILYDVTQGATGEAREPFLRPTWAASLEFAQPWAFGPRNQLGASIFTHRRSVPGVVTDVGAGGTMALTRQLTPRAQATLGYTWEASRIEASDVYFCVSVGLCVGSAINIVARRNPLAPVSLVMSLDRTDDPFTPTRGVRVRTDVEYASPQTGSAFAYQRAAVTSSVYHRVARRTVVAGRVRIGAVRALASNARSLGIPADSGEQVIHPRKLFYSGGSQSVRGYGENQLGPRVLTIDPSALTDTTLATPCTVAQLENGSCDPNIAGVETSDFQPRPLGGSALAEASVELRFPISVSAGLTGAVFVDGAIVGTRRFSDLLGATATVTPGIGVRFATPAGPVRLDIGLRPRVVERLPVITQVKEADGALRLVSLAVPRRYNAAESRGGFLGQVTSRLTLHLAIGPAF